MANFPGSVPALPTNFTNGDFAASTHPASHNNANAEVNAIGATLGANVQGSAGTVDGRITVAETTGASAASDAADALTAATAAATKIARAGFSGDLVVADGSMPILFPSGATLIDIMPAIGGVPGTQAVIADLRLNGGATIFTTQANRPTIQPGLHVGSAAIPDIVTVPAGGYLVPDVKQIGIAPTVTKIAGTAGTGTGSSTSSTLTRPATAQTGDIHIVRALLTYSSGNTPAISTPPTGATAIGTPPTTTGASGAALFEYWIRDDGTVSSWTISGISGHTFRTVEMQTLRGCVTSGNPVESVTYTHFDATTTTWTNTGVTASSTKSQLWAYLGYDANVDANTNIQNAGWTLDAGPSGLRSIWRRNPAATGATGTITVTDPGGSARKSVFSLMSIAPDTTVRPGTDLSLAIRYQ